MKATVWEDNNGEIKLSTIDSPRMTPISKHYGIKYHWFITNINEYKIHLKNVSSEFNLAYMLTKSLGK